jgi:hypothetical protein
LLSSLQGTLDATFQERFLRRLRYN